MATNRVYDPGYRLSVVCSHPSAPDSGDPVRYGYLTGVALTDEGDGGNDSTKTTVDFGPSVWDLSVEGVDDSGNSAVAVGDPIFYTDADDPVLNKKHSGYFFGIALETVGSGETGTINVLHVPHPGSGTLADGIITTAKLAAGVISADATGRALFGAGVFNAATALSVFGADSIANAFLLDAVADGAFAASAATRALFASGIWEDSHLEAPLEHYVDVQLDYDDVVALGATPVELIPAPGADLAVVPTAIAIVVNYGGTNAFTESADDLSIGWDGGAEIMEIESTGLIDQTNDEWRYITFEHDETFIPSENTAVVITNLDDEIAGNAGEDNTIDIRIYYKTVPTDGFIT